VPVGGGPTAELEFPVTGGGPAALWRCSGSIYFNLFLLVNIISLNDY
jgi:hypothetical protein